MEFLTYLFECLKPFNRHKYNLVTLDILSAIVSLTWITYLFGYLVEVGTIFPYKLQKSLIYFFEKFMGGAREIAWR